MSNILVVDDDKEIVDSIEIYLKNEGFNIFKAYDGIEALDILINHDIHLILMDIMMPKLDGIKATIKIREEKNIPIILISAKSEDSDKIIGLNIGADDYITKPFTFEGRRRTEQAAEGLEELKAYVDSLIIVSNNQLLEVIGRIPFQEAFKEADNVLRQGVQTITDLIAVPAMINLDFADVRSVMQGQGSALIGIGMSQGENKSVEAAQKSITSPLLEAQIAGARNAIVNVTGGDSISIQDASEAVEYIREAAGNDIDIIFGVAINEQIGDAIIVTVIATGFDLEDQELIENMGPTRVKPKVKHETKSDSGLELNDIPEFFRSR